MKTVPRDSIPSNFSGKIVNVKIGLDDSLKIYFNNVKIAQHLIKTSNGWSTIASHHKKLWDNTLIVENRSLSMRRHLRAIKFFIRKYENGLFI